MKKILFATVALLARKEAALDAVRTAFESWFMLATPIGWLDAPRPWPRSAGSDARCSSSRACWAARRAKAAKSSPPPAYSTARELLTRIGPVLWETPSRTTPRQPARTVNGQAVPMQPTGRVGEYVSGVRYRAWQPPNCLHPTIRPHVPLVFDLVDTWMSRSMGGC